MKKFILYTTLLLTQKAYSAAAQANSEELVTRLKELNLEEKMLKNLIEIEKIGCWSDTKDTLIFSQKFKKGFSRSGDNIVFLNKREDNESALLSLMAIFESKEAPLGDVLEGRFRELSTEKAALSRLLGLYKEKP